MTDLSKQDRATLPADNESMRPPYPGSDVWASRRCAGGLQLFDRQSGLNLLLDEVPLPCSQWALAPRYVSIALTNACDLRCPYCYAPKRSARLQTSVLQSWLLELAAHECIGIGFGGGEPTLHPDFAALCKFVARETPMAVTFTTHSHRIDPAMVAELSGAVHFVRVSVDGVGQTYESSRGRPFQAILRQLEVIRNFAPFGINVVVNSTTVRELDRVAEVATSAGARELLLLPQRGTASVPSVDNDTLGLMGEWISRYRGSVPLTLSESAATVFAGNAPVPGEVGLRSYSHVDASGVLRSSSFDKKGVPISNDGIVEAFRTLQAIHAGIDE